MAKIEASFSSPLRPSCADCEQLRAENARLIAFRSSTPWRRVRHYDFTRQLNDHIKDTRIRAHFGCTWRSMVCNGCSLHYSVVVIATVPSRNPKDGDLGEIAGSLQFQALKPDLLWIFQNRSSPLNRTCSVCGLAPYVMLYRVPFPEDGTPKRIVFYRQCYAPCSWHIHKRDHFRHDGCQ